MRSVTVNISNCTSGGGMQIGLWFVRHLLENRPRDLTLSFIINGAHTALLDIDHAADVLVVPASPMRSLRSRRLAHAFLRSRQPDCLFSIFGPPGLRWKNHVCGLANAFVTSCDVRLLREIYGFAWPIHYIKNRMFARLMTQPNFLVFETEVERECFCEREGYPRDMTMVVPNSVNNVFWTHKATQRENAIEPSAFFRLLFVTSIHPHKNNHRLPEYVRSLKQAGFNSFEIAMTLTEREFAPIATAMGSDAAHIRLTGRLDIAELIEEYELCDAVILPSAIETFSAAYNEARFTARPLLVSNIPSAQDVCASFATFFDPRQPETFVAGVRDVLRNLPERSRTSWQSRLSVMEPEEKAALYVNLIRRAAGANCEATAQG